MKRESFLSYRDETSGAVLEMMTQNSCSNYLPIGTALYSRRFESSQNANVKLKFCEGGEFMLAVNDIFFVYDKFNDTVIISVYASNYSSFSINLLKPTGYVMHQQFNIQQLYVLPTLYLCVLYLSENIQRLVPLIA